MRTAAGCLLALLFGGAAAIAQDDALYTPVVSSKLDPGLEQMLALRASPAYAGPSLRVNGGPVGGAAGTAPAMVEVLLRGGERLEAIVRDAGGRSGSRHGAILTAMLPVDALRTVAGQPEVECVEASRPLQASLDRSVPSTGAGILHAQPDPARRVTGKGVIIGFTDSGINTPHPVFRAADGRTRVLAVWDQSGTGTPPAGFGYGAEHDSAAINAHRWWQYDLAEHGTHVAGIAAGNGGTDATYVGMAPEADIIMVCNRGDDLWSGGLTTVGTLDGYNYIRAQANARGKRHVINTSQGTNLGPHDGTSLFEQAIDADVAAGSVICLAAGNEAASARHASAVVPPRGAVEIRFQFHTLAPDDSAAIPMELWYNGADRIRLSCRTMTQDVPPFAVDPGSTTVFSFDSVMVAGTSTVHSPLNNDNVIRCTLFPRVPVNDPGITMILRCEAAGDGTMPGGGRIDLWWERNAEVAFLDHVDASCTVGMPGCARTAITVGSADNAVPPGAVSVFSAGGPTRTGAHKPDLIAPGGGVVSSVPGGGFRSMSGTSMASPHVAGAVALLLEREPTLTPAQVKDRLTGSASKEGLTGAAPDDRWGAGRVDIWRALFGTVPRPEPAVLDDARQSGTDVVLSWTDPPSGGARVLRRVVIVRNGARVDSVGPGVRTYRDHAPGAGRHTYTVVAAWSDGWYSEPGAARTLNVFFAGHPWLIVDDDAGMPFESYYMAALEALGLAADRWPVITAGPITAEALAQYCRHDGGVIWFCGSDYTATLTATDQTALMSFLDAGGHLFLSGQDIGYGLSVRGTASDRAFYASYLHASLALDAAGIFSLTGDDGAFLRGLRFGITGGDGADDQLFPSAITPLSPAVPLLWYEGGATPLTGALAYRSGAQRVVYFAFGFESIDAFTMRTEVMRKVVGFLTGADTVCRAVERSPGWSMCSVPLREASMRTADIFSAPVPVALAYDGSYHATDTLVCGQGFWLADNVQRSDAVCGDTVAVPRIVLRAGWNLIAPFHSPWDVHTIVTTPPGIIVSRFFGSGSGYMPAATLLPGRAYWVKASQAGELRAGD